MDALTLLLPPMRHFANTNAATLARWCARGDRLADAKSGRDAMLRECFEFLGTDMPTAALTRSLDADDAAGHLWLRADPCHVAPDAVAVRMLACGNLGLSSDESDALARPLRPLFGDAGFALEPATPKRWYVRCPVATQLPQFDAPDTVLGDDLSLHMPTGDLGKRWRYLLNETQVELHHHPVNAERARRGATVANSIWFWGAGKLPDWVRTRYAKIFSTDDIVIALARLAKRDAEKPAANFEPIDGEILIDLAHGTDPKTIEQEWIIPIDSRLRRRDFDVLNVLFASGERFVVKRSHRWRFWRRTPPIAA